MSNLGPCGDDCLVCGEPQVAPFGRFTGGQPMTRVQAIAHWSRWHVDHRRAMRETIGEYRQTQTRCSAPAFSGIIRGCSAPTPGDG